MITRVPAVADRLQADGRGVVALWAGLALPTLIAAMAIGIEVSDWAAVKVELQRSADAAALAGAYHYSTNSGQSGVSQKAATAAAYVAQLNGVSGVSGGAANMTWNASATTLSDNNVTVQTFDKDHCPVGACTVAVKVTVTRPVSFSFARIISAHQNVTVSASSIAEVIPGSTGGPACILALQGDITGVVTNPDIGISGNVTVTATGCALRSDASVTVNGSVNLTAEAIYAAGTYSVVGGSATVTAPIYTNAGQIPDPYLGNTAVQTALSNAASIPASTASISCGKTGCTGPSGCCTNTTSNGAVTGHINPGSYGGLSASSQANVVMSPGLFEFRGDVTYQGGANLTASNVTIVTAGIGGNGSNFLGNSAQALSAATTAGATNGQVAGVFFATSSAKTTTFGGSSGAQFSGLLYQPNGTMKLAGNAEDGSAGCAEVIANDVTITGNSELSANCTGYGLPTVNSLPTTSYVSLVE